MWPFAVTLTLRFINFFISDSDDTDRSIVLFKFCAVCIRIGKGLGLFFKTHDPEIWTYTQVESLQYFL